MFMARIMSVAVAVGVLLPALLGGAAAQEVELFAYDFTGSTAPGANGPTHIGGTAADPIMRVVSVAGTAIWVAYDSTSAPEPPVAQINGYQTDSDCWLITGQPIDLTQYPSEALQFQWGRNYSGPDLEVLVSTDYDPGTHANPADATWTDITPSPYIDSGYVYETATVDLSGVNGANAYIAWHYISSGSAQNMRIDNIRVLSATPQDPDLDDDGILNVDEPAGDADGDGIDNAQDTDSNDNGVDDGTELVLGLDPWAFPTTATLFFADFEEVSFDGMEMVSVAGSADWYVREFGGDTFVQISAYNQDADSDDWLLSPWLDVSTYATVTLDFTTITKYGDTPSLQVLVSTDYDPNTHSDPGTATWTDITAACTLDDDLSDWGDWLPSGTVDVTAAAPGIAGSSTLTVAFHYVDQTGSATTYELDNILVRVDGTVEDPDLDADGILNDDEPTGDADGDGMDNAEDADSNDNGIVDGVEQAMGLDPWAYPTSTVVFLADFEDQGFDGVNTVSTASGNDWFVDTYGGTSFLRISAYNDDANASDWAIIPLLDVSPFTEVTLDFQTIARYGDARSLEVKVSTDYNPGVHGDPADATWVDVTDSFVMDDDLGAWGDWVPSGTVNLATLVPTIVGSPTLSIAFYYGDTTDSATTYELDNLLVRASGTYDSNDTDGDGLANTEEEILGTSPVLADTDGDGLSDFDEVYTYGTDPLDADTDNDGASDGFEVEHGSDPLDPQNVTRVPVAGPWAMAALLGLILALGLRRANPRRVA